MASQYNVSDSSSEGSDIYGAAVSQAIEARSFYGRSLRQRSPKNPKGKNLALSVTHLPQQWMIAMMINIIIHRLLRHRRILQDMVQLVLHQVRTVG